MTRKSAETALVMLLAGCKVEKLAEFTAASLSASYAVPLAKAGELLERARQGRAA